MYKFFSFSKLTENGFRGLPFWVGPDKLDEALDSEKMTLKHYFWSPLGGRFDLMVITTGPSIENMAETKKIIMKASVVNTDTFLVETSLESPIDQSRPVFVTLGRWADSGLRPAGSRSVDALTSSLLKHNVDLCGVYWVMCGAGFDVITLTQSDSVEAIGASRLRTALDGSVKAEVHIVYSQESFGEMCKSLGKQPE